jgi:hypothetical protein
VPEFSLQRHHALRAQARPRSRSHVALASPERPALTTVIGEPPLKVCVIGSGSAFDVDRVLTPSATSIWDGTASGSRKGAARIVTEVEGGPES